MVTERPLLRRDFGVRRAMAVVSWALAEEEEDVGDGGATAGACMVRGRQPKCANPNRLRQMEGNEVY